MCCLDNKKSFNDLEKKFFRKVFGFGKIENNVGWKLWERMLCGLVAFIEWVVVGEWNENCDVVVFGIVECLDLGETECIVVYWVWKLFWVVLDFDYIDEDLKFCGLKSMIVI